MTTRKCILTVILVLPLLLPACARPARPEESVLIARGGTLWAATCNRCHNLRPPRQFTPEQWPVIVNHMRTRADLTRSEAGAVAAYLSRVSKVDPGAGAGDGPVD